MLKAFPAQVASVTLPADGGIVLIGTAEAEERFLELYATESRRESARS